MDMLKFEIVEKNADIMNVLIHKDENSADLKLSRFETYPKQWQLEWNNIDHLTLEEFQYCIQRIGQELKDYGADLILTLFLPSEKDGTLYKYCKNSDFEQYMVKKTYILDLESFDHSTDKLDEIEILPWVDFKKQHQNYDLETLYQVEYKADFKTRQTGRWDMNNPDLEEFKSRFVDDVAVEESIFVAINDEEEIVGLTYSWIEEMECGIFFTGVLPEYRNRGIATNLKIKLANYLKKLGYTKLETNNRASNTAILRTNKKLGFEYNQEVEYLKNQLI